MYPLIADLVFGITKSRWGRRSSTRPCCRWPCPIFAAMTIVARRSWPGSGPGFGSGADPALVGAAPRGLGRRRRSPPSALPTACPALAFALALPGSSSARLRRNHRARPPVPHPARVTAYPGSRGLRLSVFGTTLGHAGHRRHHRRHRRHVARHRDASFCSGPAQSRGRRRLHLDARIGMSRPVRAPTTPSAWPRCTVQPRRLVRS